MSELSKTIEDVHSTSSKNIGKMTSRKVILLSEISSLTERIKILDEEIVTFENDNQDLTRERGRASARREYLWHEVAEIEAEIEKIRITLSMTAHTTFVSCMELMVNSLNAQLECLRRMEEGR